MKISAGLSILTARANVVGSASTVIHPRNVNLSEGIGNETGKWTASTQQTTGILTPSSTMMNSSTQTLTTSTILKPEMIRHCTLAESSLHSRQIHQNSTICQQNGTDFEHFGKTIGKSMTVENVQEKARILPHCLVDKVDDFQTINFTKMHHNNFNNSSNVTNNVPNSTADRFQRQNSGIYVPRTKNVTTIFNER
uniref:Uncharacterized protein n=1 Tax=Panagrolaimus sp. JU765 TaxID=591449 RepID=A0AC34RL52_9BILA